MAYGPVELFVIAFPGNKFRGEIAPAIGDLVEEGIIRVIDVVFVEKDADGAVNVLEMTDVEDEVSAVFSGLVREVTGLVGQEDVDELAESLDANSSAAILLFEHVWAARAAEAVRAADGKVVASIRIPADVVAEVAAAVDALEEAEELEEIEEELDEVEESEVTS